jgi:diaminopimelate epimerase
MDGHHRRDLHASPNEHGDGRTYRHFHGHHRSAACWSHCHAHGARPAQQHAYIHALAHPYANSYRYGDGNRYAHRCGNGHRYANSYIYTDAHADSHSNA